MTRVFGSLAVAKADPSSDNSDQVTELKGSTRSSGLNAEQKAGHLFDADMQVFQLRARIGDG